MALTLTTPNTLLGLMQPRTASARALTALATAILGTAVLTLSAKISVPVVPVPVTLQTFAVAALAAAFGWRIAVATVALYIAEGLSGLPVFANGGGPGYLFSPTFGFILGYLPMAYVVGLVADRGGSGRLAPLFGGMILGDAVCFAFGYLWLLALSSGAAWIDQSNVLGSAFASAVQPFIVWDVLKMAFAALTVSGAWVLMRRPR
jgi:biotin transport system substrate-specific component